MRPYHAALWGADSLAVLDETRLIPPLAEHLRAATCMWPSIAESRRQVHREITLNQDRERLGRYGDALKPVALAEQAADGLIALAPQLLRPLGGVAP
jgi:hypothetical protein